MSRAEVLHLNHVLQTVGILESVILRSFGPEGGQVLFTRDTGQAMLTRCGSRILTALRLEHPVARMVVECAWKHSTKTGDGAKTFILLLASLLRSIQTTAFKECLRSHTFISRERAVTATARRLADDLMTFALQTLGHLICLEVVPSGHCLVLEDCTGKAQDSAGTDTLQKLLASFFHTRVGHIHCEFVADLLCKMLSNWTVKNAKGDHFSLQFLSDSFAVLHTPVSGFPLSCSRLIEGLVIHRDFATPYHHTDQPVKAVAFTTCLHQKLLSTDYVLQLTGQMHLTKEGSLVRFGALAESTVERVFAALEKLGVSFILSAVKQSEAVLTLAAQRDMNVVECVSDDELNLFAQLSKTKPVTDYQSIQSEHVATLEFCRPILLGAHRYVQVEFPDIYGHAEVKPCTVVICGSAEGHTDQYACAFKDALQMLLTTWEPLNSTLTAPPKRRSESGLKEGAKSSSHSALTQTLDPGWVVRAGGTFEFLLYCSLMQHAQTNFIYNDTVDPEVYKILANALLSVPRQIYSRRHFLKIQTRFLSSCKSPSQQNTPKLDSSLHTEGHQTNLNINGTNDTPSKTFGFDSGLESVSCKYKTVLAVLQCVRSLLRVDAIVHTHTALHTSSHRPSNISCEVPEDED
ncbi:Bardet-Biedl syndrome 10 protein isoform X2 [Synchiropus splendidus]|nr:Bardet-Biedl syndrome 10 protein isoform X2 [Synchiropus splendidus]XP_053740667.1 Bardet-Biedl syndrome 10 protein isoform X2 [Synchiropus splendidus]XP_053740668.1 Bardet-Biedl syndrome 10 protein isoform X2 [Synchiropus splendidus]